MSFSVPPASVLAPMVDYITLREQARKTVKHFHPEYYRHSSSLCGVECNADGGCSGKKDGVNCALCLAVDALVPAVNR